MQNAFSRNSYSAIAITPAGAALLRTTAPLLLQLPPEMQSEEMEQRRRADAEAQRERLRQQASVVHGEVEQEVAALVNAIKARRKQVADALGQVSAVLVEGCGHGFDIGNQVALQANAIAVQA